MKIASEFDPASAQQLSRQSRDRQNNVDAWLRQMEAMLMAQPPSAVAGVTGGAVSTATRVAQLPSRASDALAPSRVDHTANTSTVGEHRTSAASQDGDADMGRPAADSAGHRPRTAASTSAREGGLPAAQAKHSGAEVSLTVGLHIESSVPHTFGKGPKSAAGPLSADRAHGLKTHIANATPETAPAIGRAMPTAATRPLAFASQPAGTGAHGAEAAHEPGRRAPRAPADDVPERSMHVHHDGDEVNVTLRDTRLTTEQRTAVIAGLAHEFRLAGLRLRSATINGEFNSVSGGAETDSADHFAPSPGADAATPSPYTTNSSKGSRHG